MVRTCFILVFFVSFLPVIGGAEDAPDFARDVLPILSDKCFVCHGPDAKDGELRLDSLEAATADLDGYRAIDPDKPEASEALARIHDMEDPMPPEDAEKQLSDSEREVLSRWIKSGGAYAEHWAFVPPERPVKAAGNSIDDFVAAGLKAKGVDFAPEAEPGILARRVALTLTGLPPGEDRLRKFIEGDWTYEYLVEDLLADPRFGEHQARYWLDAVRYGDTHGLHLDNKRGIFPYRDWVVKAMNENLPLDQFITWQLAGDLLPDPTLEQRVATGFVRMNPSTAEGGVIPAEFQAKNTFDRTETIGTVLLGMTLSCARCHTHKYDPIVHEEYYQLFAFFNNTSESPLDGNKYQYPPVLKAPSDQSDWAAWNKLKRDLGAMRKTLENDASALQTMLGSMAKDSADLGEASLPTLKAAFGDLEKRNADFKAAVETRQAEAAKLKNRMAEFEKRKADLEKRYTTTLVAQELTGKKRRVTKVLTRGEYSQPVGEALSANIPAVLGSLPGDGPHSRLDLARWVTSAENPVVTRVWVNRIWQRVFGEGIVRSPEDFGVQGRHPTHPELLDWLSVELREGGWDLKATLKQMVMSRTFRQSSAWRDGLDDPENLWLARGPAYRLDAEVLRDMGLWVSGLLDPHMGGEGVKPYQPAGLWASIAHPSSNSKRYERSKGSLLYRRSLYVYWKRTSPHPMMMLFDAPDRESSCVRRSRTNTALQSLALLNETQRVEMGRKLAERLVQLPVGGDAKEGAKEHDAARLDYLFRWMACRGPTDSERDACLSVLDSLRERYAEAENDAVGLLETGEASREESLPVGEVAAWTQLAMTVLASDAAILLY